MKNNKMIELNANENSLGMSDSAKKAVTESLSEGFRYPDNVRAALISKVASIHGVAENQISLGNFIFHEIKGDLKTYIARMRDSGIKVGRDFPPITGFNRVTLGTPDEMAVFIKVLKSFRKKGWV